MPVLGWRKLSAGLQVFRRQARPVPLFHLPTPARAMEPLRPRRSTCLLDVDTGERPMHRLTPPQIGRPQTHRGVGVYRGMAEWRNQFPFRYVQPGLWQELEPSKYGDGDSSMIISGTPMVLLRQACNCKTGTYCQEPDLYTTYLSPCAQWQHTKPPRGRDGYWPEWCSGMKLRLSADKRKAGQCTR